MTTVPVELWRRADDEFVEGTLHTALMPSDLTLLERSWGEARDRLLKELELAEVPRADRPQSLHWDWREKADELKLLEARCFGVLCGDAWQAAMLTRTAANVSRLDESKGKPLVYIEYLEVAPWNWKVKPLDRRGEYGGLGRLLFRQAVVQSVEEGFAGRVGLHALHQAESFYAALGMRRISLDDAKRLPYYELSAGDAQEMLNNEGGAS